MKQNYTIVMVTHNMQQAARISDETVFFLLGGSRGTGRDGKPVLHAEGQTDGRVYHRTVRLIYELSSSI